MLPAESEDTLAGVHPVYRTMPAFDKVALQMKNSEFCPLNEGDDTNS